MRVLLHMGFIQGESRDQSLLFPLLLDELIPAEHPCRVIEAFVAYLDVPALGFQKASPKATGRPPYDPADLLKLYLYGYLQRIRSSRRLERECQRNVELMWLLNRLMPDHKTIAEFRRHNGKALRGAGARFVGFCRGVGLVKGEWIAIDGSKFQAVASSKAVVSRDRLQIQREQLEHRMAAYLAALDEGDAQECEPQMEPQAIRAALDLLRQEQAAITHVLEQMEASGDRHVTLTEPDARVMKGHGPAYNLQTAVDAEHAIIVSHAVTAEVTDNRSLQPVAEAAAQVLQRDTIHVVADAGYSSGEQAAALETRGIIAHVPANRSVNNQGDGTLFDRTRFIHDSGTDTLCCPANKTLVRKQIQRRDRMVIYTANAQDCGACALKAQCTSRRVRLVSRHMYEEALARMNARATPHAMRLRRSTVEHPFATLKYTILEKPRFLLRGLWGAGTEMALATLAYNLKRAISVLGARELQSRLVAT